MVSIALVDAWIANRAGSRSSGSADPSFLSARGLQLHVVRRPGIMCNMRRFLHRSPALGRPSIPIALSAAVLLGLGISSCSPGTPKSPCSPIADREKWIGCWHEPYPVVGVRGIMDIRADGEGLAGTRSDPAVPNGTAFNIRIPEDLTDFFAIDATTITCRRGGRLQTLRYVQGNNGEPACIEMEGEVKGTIGAWLGQTEPHRRTYRKQ